MATVTPKAAYAKSRKNPAICVFDNPAALAGATVVPVFNLVEEYDVTSALIRKRQASERMPLHVSSCSVGGDRSGSSNSSMWRWWGRRNCTCNIHNGQFTECR